MSDDAIQAPKIEFPCPRYPLKVIGDASPDFTAVVLDVVRRHAPELDHTNLVVQDSRNGRFLSVRLEITATGVEQLQAIHMALRATGRVHMVL